MAGSAEESAATHTVTPCPVLNTETGYISFLNLLSLASEELYVLLFLAEFRIEIFGLPL